MYENRLKVKDVQCTIYVYVYDKEKFHALYIVSASFDSTCVLINKPM